MAKKITQEEFSRILPLVCDAETSADSHGWTPENPLWAHCAMASEYAQKIFGGDVLFGKVKTEHNITHKIITTSHYWNRMPDGKEVDFTRGQFFGEPQRLSSGRRITCSVQCLRIQKAKRYKLFALRASKKLSGDNAMFDDPIYQKCFLPRLIPNVRK